MSQRRNDPARRGSGSTPREREDHPPDVGSWRPTRSDERRRRRGYGTAIIGIGVLALGAIMLLDNLGLVDGENLFEYWPILLILVGLSHLVRPRGSRSVVGGVIWIAIGAVVLLGNLGYLSVEIWDLWPVVLVIVGVGLILRPFRRARITADENSGVFEAAAILGGAKRRIAVADFRGGDAVAVMGGCEIDLTQCGSDGQPAEIDTFAFWGGIEIRVPEEWKVEIKGMSLLGSYGNDTRVVDSDSAKLVVIRGLAFMGGVEIKN